MSLNDRVSFSKAAFNKSSMLNPTNGFVVPNIMKRVGLFLWHQQFKELCGVYLKGSEPLFKNGLLEGFVSEEGVFSETAWIGTGMAPFNRSRWLMLSDGLGYFTVAKTVHSLADGELVLYNLDWCGVVTYKPEVFYRTRPRESTVGVFYHNDCDDYYVVRHSVYSEAVGLKLWWGDFVEAIFLEDPYTHRIYSWASYLFEQMDLSTLEDHTVDELVERLHQEEEV